MTNEQEIIKIATEEIKKIDSISFELDPTMNSQRVELTDYIELTYEIDFWYRVEIQADVKRRWGGRETPPETEYFLTTAYIDFAVYYDDKEIFLTEDQANEIENIMKNKLSC